MMNAQHSIASAASNFTLSHLLSMIGLAPTKEASVDWTTVSAWLRESKEMRAEASALAEKPPLLSY
ncbi:MAG: hypothetical protein JO255_02085 [Alphaproteobacteria bacterium]|nr:hypothetical protein [Alphaproteobacteria bacterium]